MYTMWHDVRSCLDLFSSKWRRMLLPLVSAALFVASGVQITDYFHRLEWLNIDTLRMARAVLPLTGSVGSLSSGEIENRPIKVVVITNEMFERDFDQASPLDRTKLTLLFNDLLAAKNAPAVLAVDLDLSPSPSPSQAEKQFTADLITAVKNSATQLILITPMPTMLPASINTKLDWMHKICASGIRFALPDIVGTQNTTMNMPVGTPILGYEAYRVAKGLGDDYLHRQFRKPVNPLKDDYVPRICDFSDQELKSLLQILGLRIPAIEVKDYQRINFKFPESIDLIRLSSLKSLGSGSEDLSGLKDRVVFLGGDYGSGDKYQTPVGQLSGLYLHVAAYYSYAFKISALSKPVALIVDFIAAILFFILFVCVRNQISGTHELMLRFVKVFLPAALSFLAILFAAFALGWWNVWLHPAAVITGMGAYITVVHPSGFSKNTEDPKRINNDQYLHIDRFLKHVIYFLVVFGGLYIVLI